MDPAHDSLVRLPTVSGRGFYQFRVDAFGQVQLERGSYGQDGEPLPLVDHYASFRPNEDRGGEAIRLLMERVHQLEAFFEAVRKLSITRYAHGRLEGFIERGDVEDETETAWELVSQMIEEADAAEDKGEFQ